MIESIAKYKSVRVMFYIGIGAVYLYGLAAVIAAVKWW